jgi:hypothetical protein
MTNLLFGGCVIGLCGILYLSKILKSDLLRNVGLIGTGIFFGYELIFDALPELYKIIVR